MPWLALLSASNPSPADSVTSAATTSILSTGVVGALLIVLGYLYARGWRLVSPAREKAVRDEARADLLKDIERGERQAERLEQDKKAVEQQRDEAQKFTQSNLVPLLVNFTNATTALIPLLQELVRYREDTSDSSRRHR